RSGDDLADGIRMAGQRADAMIVVNDPMFTTFRIRIGELAAENRLPTMHQGIPAVQEGGLMTYGAQNGEAAHLAAVYLDRLLKGATPGDLPILVPTAADFVINLKAAQAIGLTIPEAVLAQATDLIR